MAQEIDYEKLSLTELRELADKELKEVSQIEPPAEKVRDDKGRFTEKVKEEEATTTTTTTEPEKVAYRRVIDLGDGAGPEVFEADTLEELVDKIADAKGNATKKIREQEKELKDLRTKKQGEEKQQTADEEFVNSQELLSKPTEAFKKLFRQTTGVDIEDFKSTHKTIQSAQVTAKRRAIGDQFIKSHAADYADTDRNAGLMNKWLALHNDYSTEGFEKAYQDLKQSGLLDFQGEGANAGQTEQSKQQERIVPVADKVTPPQQTKKASGLSTQNRTAVPTTPAQPSEADAYNMPIEKLRELANRQLAVK